MSSIQSETLRDRMWLFSAWSGKDDYYLERGGIRGGSRMTPAEGAFWLDVPNLMMVLGKGDYRNKPVRPRLQKPWRTMTEFEQYSVSFMPLKRVIWTVVGSGGQHEGDELPEILELAEKFPNIDGIFFDDFFIRAEGRGAYSPEQLAQIKERARVGDKRLDMWSVVYSPALYPDHPRTFHNDRPLEEYLQHFDYITLWPDSDADEAELRRDIDEARKVAPNAKIALGLKIYFYITGRSISIPALETQCETARKLVHEGVITDMVFLANSAFDIGLEAAYRLREWVQEVADEPVQSRGRGIVDQAGARSM